MERRTGREHAGYRPGVSVQDELEIPAAIRSRVHTQASPMPDWGRSPKKKEAWEPRKLNRPSIG